MVEGKHRTRRAGFEVPGDYFLCVCTHPDHELDRLAPLWWLLPMELETEHTE